MYQHCINVYLINKFKYYNIKLTIYPEFIDFISDINETMIKDLYSNAIYDLSKNIYKIIPYPYCLFIINKITDKFPSTSIVSNEIYLTEFLHQSILDILIDLINGYLIIEDITYLNEQILNDILKYKYSDTLYENIRLIHGDDHITIQQFFKDYIIKYQNNIITPPLK